MHEPFRALVDQRWTVDASTGVACLRQQCDPISCWNPNARRHRFREWSFVPLGWHNPQILAQSSSLVVVSLDAAAQGQYAQRGQGEMNGEVAGLITSCWAYFFANTGDSLCRHAGERELQRR